MEALVFTTMILVLLLTILPEVVTAILPEKLLMPQLVSLTVLPMVVPIVTEATEELCRPGMPMSRRLMTVVGTWE